MVEKPDEVDPRKFLAEAAKAARGIGKMRFEAFGSAGRASGMRAVPMDGMADKYVRGELTAGV